LILSKRELVLVRLHFPASSQEHIMQRSDVKKFVEASLKLHFEPGINPHNKVKTTKIWMITQDSLKSLGRFWWSTPDLMKNEDPNGAEIWGWAREKILWHEKEVSP